MIIAWHEMSDRMKMITVMAIAGGLIAGVAIGIRIIDWFGAHDHMILEEPEYDWDSASRPPAVTLLPRRRIFRIWQIQRPQTQAGT